MPSATIMTTTPTSKPRISNFSIESIVGNKIKSSNSPHNHQYLASGEDSDDCSGYPNLQKSPKLPTSAADIKRELILSDYSKLIKRTSNLTPSPQNTDINDKTITRLSDDQQDHQNNNKSRLTPTRTRSPSPSNHPPNPMMLHHGMPAGLIRPMPVAAGEMKQNMSQYQHDMLAAGAHNPHFLAQFQAAAALAHAQASQGFPPQGFPQHPSHMQNAPRDSYPLYPWLLSRHGRIFPHRFPGSESHYICTFALSRSIIYYLKYCSAVP